MPTQQWQNDLGVTNQRVHTLERAVQQLANDQQQMGTRLSAEIGNVATQMSAELKGLNLSLAERSKIPWPALGVMLAFITTIGGLVWYPVKDRQDRIDGVLAKLSEVTVTKPELEYRFTISGQRRDELQRVTEERMRENREEIKNIRTSIVPRGEHEEKWTSSTQRFSDLQRQLDAVQRDISGIYSPRDALTRLYNRLDALEAEVRARPRPPT